MPGRHVGGSESNRIQTRCLHLSSTYLLPVILPIHILHSSVPLYVRAAGESELGMERFNWERGGGRRRKKNMGRMEREERG